MKLQHPQLQDVIVIDNFYRDPMRVREFALSLEYENETVPNYPGFQSRIPALSQGAIDKLSSAIGDSIDLDICRHLMGYFRYITYSGNSRLHVHLDGYDWTCVIYLTPNPAAGTGTSFYRHRRTGLIGPPSLAQMKVMGFQDFDDFEDQVVEIDTLDDSAWELLGHVENQFNRCVIFPASRLFHSHSSAFGKGIEDGRLTQNFFIQTLRDSKHA